MTAQENCNENGCVLLQAISSTSIDSSADAKDNIENVYHTHSTYSPQTTWVFSKNKMEGAREVSEAWQFFAQEDFSK